MQQLQKENMVCKNIAQISKAQDSEGQISKEQTSNAHNRAAQNTTTQNSHAYNSTVNASLTNENIVHQLKQLVDEERKIAAQVIAYLHEVDARKLHLELGYPSLYEFCTRELGYSEGSAHRRISAMRLIKSVPEVEGKIKTGEISLSVASMAQNFFLKQKKKDEELSKDEKLDLLKKLENTSTRKCEKVLLEISPEPVRSDKERQITAALTEIRITVDHNFINKIELIKNQLSHSHPNLTTSEALSLALDFYTQKKDPLNNAQLPSAQKCKSIKWQGCKGMATKMHKGIKTPGQDSDCRFETSEREVRKTRYIPRNVLRAVWAKSNKQCSYVSPVTGQKCGSRRFLEVDHIIAYSRGGKNSLDNLQLLCDAHNRAKGAQSISTNNELMHCLLPAHERYKVT